MLKNIKDRTPNEHLVRHLEIALEQAKSGELRSYVGIYGWYDDTWSDSWVIDKRSDEDRMLGRLGLAYFNAMSSKSLSDVDSPISRALD